MTYMNGHGLIDNIANQFYNRKPDNLRIAISTLDTLLVSWTDPEWDHNKLIYYKECRDDNARFMYRLSYQKITQIMRKQLNIHQTLKTLLQSQKKLNEQIKKSTQNQQDPRTKQKETQLSELLWKMGKILKKDQGCFRDNNFSTQVQDMMVECNRVMVKYHYLWRALDVYKREEKRSFTEVIGEVGLEEFQALELTRLYNFDQNLRSKSTISAIKNAVFNSVDKELQLIQKTLQKLQNCSNLTQLYTTMQQSQSQSLHRKLFTLCTNPTKKLLKLQTILSNVRNCIITKQQTLSNTISQINSDIDLDPKTKLNLKDVVGRLVDYEKCGEVFGGVGLKLGEDVLRMFFGYVNGIEELMRKQLSQIQEVYGNTKELGLSAINFNEKPDFFNLSSYFLALIQLIKFSPQPQPQPHNPKYTSTQKTQIDQILQLKDQICKNLKIELDKKQEQIQLLKWRVFNLNQQISKYESQEQVMMERLNRESIYPAREPVRDTVGNLNLSEEVLVEIYDEEELKDVEEKGKETEDVRVDMRVQRVQMEVQTQEQGQGDNQVFVQEITRLKRQIQQLKYLLRCKDEQLQLSQRKLQEQTQQLHQKTTTLTEQITTLTIQNTQLSQTNQHQQSQLLQANQTLQTLQTELSTKNQNYENMCLKQEELIREAREYQEVIAALRKDGRMLGCFVGEVFQDGWRFRDGLVGAIEKRLEKEIASTKLIYRLDQRNTAPVHKYIDSIDNWVVIFKLKNGQLVGGFCQQALQATKKSTSGFMFNLTQQKFYKLKKGEKPKIYQYDQYYLVIGNSEIRYRFHTRKLETCFGSNFKYFQTGNDTAVGFFGQNTDDMEIQGFQFYQVCFRTGSVII